MDRQKYYILLFFLSIPFNFMVFKNWWTDLQSNWSPAYPFLVLFAALAEVYFSRRKLVIAGMFGMGAFALGVFLHIPHWPGAALFTFLGLVSFMIIPFWSALQAREQKTLRLIISSWILMYGTGTIFKIFHWPTSALFVILSMKFLTVVTIALGVTLWQAKQKQNERNF